MGAGTSTASSRRARGCAFRPGVSRGRRALPRPRAAESTPWPGRPHRGRPAADSRGHRRPGALPRVRAAPRGRRPPVPPSARARARVARARGRVEPHLGRDACLPLQLVQLRLRAAPPVRGAAARMVHRVDGPIGVYRGFDDGTDERIVRGQRRARRRDDPPVPLLAQKHRARVRASRAGRDPERRRPGDLPSARDARAARGQAGAGRRDELVGQPAEGRRRARLARPQPRPRALRADLRRPAAAAFEHIRVVGPRLAGARRPDARHHVYLAPATTTRARTRCSRRWRAACRPPTARAAGTPSSSAEAGLPFDVDEELADVLERLAGELDERRAAISTPRSRGSPTATSRSSGSAAPP